MSTPVDDKSKTEEAPSPWKEITQPFIDLVHAPRALWGINLGYFLEGLVYFGMLGYLAMHFSDFIFQGVEGADEWSHDAVMVLTAGITIAMLFLGSVADKKGVRFAFIAAFILMLGGRSLIAGAPNVLGLKPVQPGVMVGDTVSLHVTQIGTRPGGKAITKSEVISNDAAGDVSKVQGMDLAAGAGLAPAPEFESRLVRLGKATVVDGEGQEWKIRYGTGNVETTFVARAAEELGFCKGASFELSAGYVARRKDSFVVRSHWSADVKNFNSSACEKPGEKKQLEIEEASLRSDRRWPSPKEATGSSQDTTVGQLRNLPDGKVDFVLRNARITYVRNGGYFLEQGAETAAIAVFVSPEWSHLHWVTLAGMLLVVLGYGMYQPAAYAGVRQFTTSKTSGMAFAMLYALSNLGGWVPSAAFLLRDRDYLGLGIPGTFWVYTGFTVLALIVTILILSRKTVEEAISRAKAESAREKNDDGPKDSVAVAESALTQAEKAPDGIPGQMWILLLGILAIAYYKLDKPLCYIVCAAIVLVVAAIGIVPGKQTLAIRKFIANHPLADLKFFFFIFALIPVQTLFTYNWFVLPQYIQRAYAGWIGQYFEIASNANPALIFLFVPVIAALTQKKNVYSMMIAGTAVMAAPAFLLALGPHPWTLGGYIVLMTVGEAMWQPRFLQYAAEIAPEGRTGEYMGVANLPWFLTKMLVPLLYSGRMMDRFCPAEGPKNTQVMWLIFGCIAAASPLLLLSARGWISKGFKTTAA